MPHLEMAGAHAIDGPINFNNKKVFEASLAGSTAHGPNQGATNGKPVLGSYTAMLKTTANLDKFMDRMRKRLPIGIVTITRHAMAGGNVVNELVVTLTNAVIRSVSHSLREGDSEMEISFSYDTIKTESFNPDGTSAGYDTIDLTN